MSNQKIKFVWHGALNLEQKNCLSLLRFEMPPIIRQIALTYDDGPDPGGTEAVLSALEAAGFTATFFVLLSRVRKYRQILQEVISSGHEIALHGMDHRDLTGFPPRQVRHFLSAAKSELEDASGREIIWFRPPYGKQDRSSWHAAVSTGLIPVVWTKTLHDWLNTPRSQRVADTLDDIQTGEIMLAHDSFAGDIDAVNDGPPPAIDRYADSIEVFAGLRARDISGTALTTIFGAAQQPIFYGWTSYDGARMDILRWRMNLASNDQNRFGRLRTEQ